MSSYMEEILKKLGWEDGFQIPVANSDNQKLEEEVAKLTLQKIKAKTTYENSTVKLENIDNHLKYITQECEQTQSLITTHVQQLQVEEHKLRTTQAEKEKYEHDIKQTEKQISDMKERQQGKKLQLEKAAKKLDKLKAETDWDKEALKAWEESLQKRDDDNEVIKKFSKEDARKYNELEAKRQNLELEFVDRKQTIEKMVSDLTNYERTLERTGKMIKQQVIERNALIQQWKDSVKILHQRDSDIDRMQVQIFETQEIIEKEQEKLQETKEFYENEVRNNNELEHETQQLNFLNSKMRRELNDLNNIIFFLNSQADTVRRTMLHVSKNLEKERRKKTTLKEQLESREKKFLNNRNEVDLLRQKMEKLKHSNMSAEERTRQLEKLIDHEQKQHQALQNECETLQNSYFRAQHELQETYEIGKVIALDMSGALNNIDHLEKHIEDQRKDVGKRKEDAYELDFKIDELQRKILINENVIYNEDTEELEIKLSELEAKMTEHTEVKNMLKDQVNKIRDDMRRLTTAIVADQSQLAILKDKLQHQNLNYEGGQKQLKDLKCDIQDKQVEENILRLRVNQLRKAMKKEETSIYTMKKFKLTLEQATKERLVEIGTNKEILLVKRRNLNEDKGRLKCDIMERQIRLDQFLKKYEIVLASLGRDELGQTYTVTHFKIKNAQEKFLLQQEGDELDAKIKKAEKEIFAMENTLKVVNLTNAAFKQSLGSVDDDGQEVQEMKALEEQLLLVNDVLRDHRKKLAVKKQELEDIQVIYNDHQQQKVELQDKLLELEEEYVRINKEKMLKEEKIKRAENCLKTASKKVSQKESIKYDKDLNVRQLKDANISVMQRLVEMSIRYQEISPLITRYTLEYNVKIPEKRTLSTLTASTETTRSSPSCNSKQMEPDAISVKSTTSTTTTSSKISKVDLTFRV